MDYLSAFRSLKTNNKYARKSPHKAILLLSVIDMFENKQLTENVIKYNNCLLKTFQKIWNKVLPNEATFFTTVYFPFWYMQSEDFWLNVPTRGKEDIFREYWENRIKPTETRVKEIVQYAVLEDELYFMMTLPSGRASLKRVLLEEYTELSEHDIDKMCVVKDLVVEDNSTKAIETYQVMLQGNQTIPSRRKESECGSTSSFSNLSDNLQIVLNYEYYSFLKSHVAEREVFREIFPSVEQLASIVMYNPYKKGELNYSFSVIYENFLRDLRVSLMSEDDSVLFIDAINDAIDLLQEELIQNKVEDDDSPLSALADYMYVPQTPKEDDKFRELYFKFSSDENRHGKAWTADEEEFISMCYDKGWNCERIAEKVGRTAVAIYMRLKDKLGYEVNDIPEGIESIIPARGEVSSQIQMVNGFRIENKDNKCYIFNEDNCVFSTTGLLKIIRGRVYRFNYKPRFFTVKAVEQKNGIWNKGSKLLVAESTSDLYRKIKICGCSIDLIENFIESSVMRYNQILFSGHWYDGDGNYIE